ncbi:MAG: hypothetical protein JWM91_221 [Rhodospirillales bacterium]|nr:hypothetical protein [Rhodospirillales bacterium]
MTEEKRGGPPSRGGPGGGNRDNRPGGGGRGGPRKGGGFGKGPVKQARAETYESLKELTRGEGFRIDKYVVAEKGTHRLVKTEYRLTREGLKSVQMFQRLVDAQAAAIAPLPEPEPEPEPVEEIAADVTDPVETAGETTDVEAVHGEAPAERESVESVPAESGSDSVEHLATERPAD